MEGKILYNSKKKLKPKSTSVCVCVIVQKRRTDCKQESESGRERIFFIEKVGGSGRLRWLFIVRENKFEFWIGRVIDLCVTLCTVFQFNQFLSSLLTIYRTELVVVVVLFFCWLSSSLHSIYNVIHLHHKYGGYFLFNLSKNCFKTCLLR